MQLVVVRNEAMSAGLLLLMLVMSHCGSKLSAKPTQHYTALIEISTIWIRLKYLIRGD